MEEVRYEDYEDKDRRTQRFFQDEEKREDMSFLSKVGVGVAVGAGLLTVGHRTGAMRKIARYLDVEGKATIQAARETLDGQGNLFRGEDKLTISRMKELKESFVPRRQDIIKERRVTQANILETRPDRELQMAYELRRRREVIGSMEKGKVTGEIPYNIQEGIRHAAVLDDFKKSLPDATEEMNKALSKGELGVLDWGTDKQIKLLLKEHGNSELETDEVWSALKTARDKYVRKDFLADETNANTVKSIQEKTRAITAERIAGQTSKNSKVKDVMIGHKQATVNDILKLNEEGKIRVNAVLKADINDVMKYNKEFGEAVFDDNLYLSTKNGELFDYNVFKEAGRKQADWWANTIPGGLLHLRDILNVKKAREEAGIKIFQRGTILSGLNGHMGVESREALNEEVMFVYGKFVRVNDADAIKSEAAFNILNPKRDMYLNSSQFGTAGKMHRHISGIMTDSDAPRNPIANVLDLNRQDKDDFMTQGFSVFSKFLPNSSWERNVVRNRIKNGIKDSDEFYEMNTYLKLNTKGYNARTLNNLKPSMPQHVQDYVAEHNINFSLDEDINKLFKYIGKKEKGRTNTPHTDFGTLFRQFERSPDRVLKRQMPIGESNPILGHQTQMRTGQDDIKQQVSLYLTHETLLGRAQATSASVLLKQADIFRTELRGLHHDGKLLKEDLEQAEQLLNYSMFRSQGFDASNNNAAIHRVSRLFETNETFQASMRDMSRRTNPMWERHSNIKPENKVNDEFLAINESNLGGIAKQMFSPKSTWKERVSGTGGALDLAKQLSPFTGRKNMEDVTTLNMFGVYYPVYRLQDALGNARLGLSDKSMGSTASMFGALMATRIFPVYAGVEAVKYADWKVDQWTGEGLDERWENYKANDRLGKANNLTEFEKYDKEHERMLKPGLEHWEAMPDIHIPGVGPISAGDALNNIFAPFMGKATLREEDMMTYDETVDDIFNGEEEIRKSRYWFAGSKSAFRGDRITEFAPNSFRQAHSDYEWTNTNATGEEYWGNHILPTLENPLGIVSKLIGTRDPYWYEKKHEHDRPYLLTGELFNPNTMLLGDIGNATIGKLIKPVKEMHPEYWGDPVLINENETSQLGNRPSDPVHTRVSPAGRSEHEVLATVEDYGSDVAKTDYVNATAVTDKYELGNSGARYFITQQLDEDGNQTGAYVSQDMQTNQTMYVPANIAGEGVPMEKLFAIAGTPAPDGSEVKGVSIASMNPSQQVQVSTQPRAMFDEEYAYKQDIMNRQMQNIKDPRSASWRLQEGIENWTEPLGVYKWLVNDEILGRSTYDGEMVIQRADAANNASNRFWESELGSLGGAMSEIGRRFVRRDSGQLDFYNPIRNTMPDWMPGADYFINFQTGDPYSKLSNGERRLPGEAYESLNELHSDDTGRYGAFDKFKILADAAPFSDEYNFWSQYLLDNLPEGDLRKEATDIRRQVSDRRSKQEFTPYRFKGNEIVEQQVTVTKFLDDYTFLTEELGDTPIRLAGMEYRKKAEGVLQSYFAEGDKVTIGVTDDPNKQISKDTYGTMRAVIFNKLGNINQEIIKKGEMVENRNDFSAAGVHARFTPQELARGRRWETMAHTSSPINTKFMQARTAVEEYERDQVYGKDWATWDNFMLSDYIIPSIQGVGRYDSPLWSGLAGGTTGLVLGRFLLPGGKATKIAGVAGALFGLGSNAFYKHHEKKTGEAWIPERRRVENDINEYFDILKYMKYEGLYQKAREEIVHQTGYDVEDFATVIEEQKTLTSEKRKELETEKKQLFLDQPKGWEDRRLAINEELETISENWDEMYLPENFLQALNYKEERDTTIYGVDPFGDLMKVMQAFPYKDKRFFTEFVNANLADQEKLLKILPENQRRIYKTKWGMEAEEKAPLEYYMEKYDIPDWNWEGWKPEYNLEDIKVKAVQEAGADMSDFNFWDDDVQASKYTPDLQPTGNQYQGSGETSFEGYNNLRQNLINILQGQGLQDVRVTVSPSDSSSTAVNVDYTEDRSQEIEKNLRENGEQYV